MVCLFSRSVTPLTHLIQRLQWMDERGDAVLDFVNPKTSPFDQCCRSLGSMLSDNIQDGELGSIFWHYATTEDKARDLNKRTWRLLTAMDSQMQWRFRVFKAPPWQFLLRIDHRHPDPLGVLQQLYRMSFCCRDYNFSQTLTFNTYSNIL